MARWETNRSALDCAVRCTYTELEQLSETELDTNRCPMDPMDDSSGSNNILEDRST